MEKEVKSSSKTRLNSIKGGASASGQSKRTGKFKRSKGKGSLFIYLFSKVEIQLFWIYIDQIVVPMVQ
jgi:hypothetical protein